MSCELELVEELLVEEKLDIGVVGVLVSPLRSACGWRSGRQQGPIH